MKRSAAVMILMMIYVASFAAGDSIGYDGFKLGMKYSDAMALYKTKYPDDDRISSDPVKNLTELDMKHAAELALKKYGARRQVILLQSTRGKADDSLISSIRSIEFFSTDLKSQKEKYDEVTYILTKKYGKPVKNDTWKIRTQTIRLTRGRIDGEGAYYLIIDYTDPALKKISEEYYKSEIKKLKDEQKAEKDKPKEEKYKLESDRY